MPDASELVAAADTLAGASLYNEAISTYTKAIELTPSPTYYVKRSTAYQRSGNLTSALSDAEQAVILAHKRGKAELIAAAQIRRGISLNGLKRFADSNAVFQFARKAGSKDKSIDIWISKNNRELAKLSEEEKKSTVEAVPKTLSYVVDHTTPSQEVKEKNVSDNNTVIEKEKSEKPDASKALEKTETSEKPKIPEPAAPPAQLPLRVRHEWYQTDQHVFIDIFFKNIPKDQCSVDIDPTSLTVTFPLPTGSEFTFTLDPLFSTIIPESSSYEILSTKLSVKLQKSTRAWKWPSLENTTSTVDSPPTPAAPIAYPTSSRTGVKNWDALEREAIKDAETWEKPDGDAAANALFKELYKNATPEVRKAMEKSYVESNGTALSTNWEEVSKGRVETKPPDSMLAKNWEK